MIVPYQLYHCWHTYHRVQKVISSTEVSSYGILFFGRYTILLSMLSSPRLLFYIVSQFNVPALYAKTPCYPVFYARDHARCANGEGGGLWHNQWSSHTSLNVTSCFALYRDVMNILCSSPWEFLKINHNWINPQMSCIKTLHQNSTYVALVLLLRRVRQKYGVKTAAFSKTQKSDGSKWRFIILIHMIWNKNKNSTRLIDGS